ncbi:MAG TPA: hypothetical protein VK684_00975 [Edaphobacter sp.]|nr:hypothetical protein [Edaphobacter sp.]
MKRHLLTISLLILGLCVLGASAAAQTPSQDFFKISYFANNGVAGAPDATVRIDNPGSPFSTVPDTAAAPTSGDVNLCAMIYVFDNDQQLSECCGCLVTPNGLRTLSVRKDLTGNPLTGVVSNNGVIKIVSALPNPAGDQLCDPDGSNQPVPTVRAWASHVQNKVGTAYPITETAFTDATLSEDEFFFNLNEQCLFAERLGSGKGVCSCGTGD